MPSKSSRGREKGKGAGLPKAAQPACRPQSKLFCSWVFNDADQGGPWACTNIAEGDLEKIIIKLGKFETMSRTDIGRARAHPIPIGSLSPDAQKRLEEIKCDATDSLFSFHIDGKKRLWCLPPIRLAENQHVYRILWWDPEHEVYPSKKKHT